LFSWIILERVSGLSFHYCCCDSSPSRTADQAAGENDQNSFCCFLLNSAATSKKKVFLVLGGKQQKITGRAKQEAAFGVEGKVHSNFNKQKNNFSFWALL